MATPEQSQRRLQLRDIAALETLRKLRRDRAEAEVAVARVEESKRHGERVAAASARSEAFSRLQQWNQAITTQDYVERIRATSGMSQAIYDFEQLTSALRTLEFAEYAAKTRETLASNEVARTMLTAKVAAVSHEKIVECQK